MAAKKPKVGDMVIWHGRLHQVIALPKRAVMRGNTAEVVNMTIFENEGYRGLVKMDDLVWSAADGAFFGPGQLLANDERVLYEALMGVRPPAETHMTARKLLDNTDYASEVPMDRLLVTVQRRKGLAGKDAEAYAVACLAHCAELKEARNG